MKTEKEYLSLVQKRDKAALVEIYDVYSPMIYRYAYRQLGDHELAEDCTSETFARFLHALRDGNGPKNYLKAYLYRIAHNWITDMFRKPMNENTLDDNHSLGSSATLEQVVSDHVDVERIRVALKSLTAEQRMVITLKFLEGWENREIAKALSKREGAIRALQMRALQAIQQELVEDEVK